ncbi:MAG: Integral membrane protein MviN [Candidatus Pacebacteria bacterium GW2011_GWF2_38_9]|nr:MAG: integral membrane protein MviN, virulence factor [candidate division TM6 bacterium GW2011_GWF2_28_16]KKQ09559.1 MAG: Integral membrane protein MviN [Candidatus Pacebacteria bacterium GW2011_GWF1_36_5]KKQ88469.1 MAG: Integral membrane protein MviN [Candidatus Pacebacteria bacterium GW2011_GWF2_38_9]HAZ73396.1 murein biosynthesis integral membrane protein MurJ [Candidatus Paceibacterota bacterium]
MLSVISLTKIFNSNGKWLERKQNSILSAALVITLANIFSSVFGLWRERVLINQFFSTDVSQKAYEAFQVAFQIPDMIFQLIVMGALAASFIPLFTELKKKNEKDAFHFTSIVMNWVLLVFLVVSVLAFIFAEPITAFRTGVEFTPEQIATAVKLTRLMLFAQIFFAISNFLTGILQAYQRFVAPALAPIFYNLGIMLGTVFLAKYFGIYAAGLGVLIGAFLHMAIQLPLVWKMGFRFKFDFNLKFTSVKKLFSLMPPRLLTVGVTEFQNLAMGFFATTIGDLSFVVVKLASRLMSLPIRFFGVPISQASLSFLSEESAVENRQKFNRLLLQSLNQIAFFAMPASVLLLILRVPIVRLVFGTYNFPWGTTVLTGKVVAIIAISITAQAMVQLLVRAFHALKDTKTPFIITLVTVASYLLVSYLSVFVFSLDVLGLGLAISFSAFLELILFLFLLNKKLACFNNKEFWGPQIKILASSFFMAVFLYLPFKILDEVVFDTSKTIDLIALTVSTASVASLVYIYFSVLFDVKELTYFRNILGKFGKWKEAIEDSSEVLLDSSTTDSER